MQEMKDSREPEDLDVVLIKDSKMDEQGSELEKQQQQREAFLSQQRELMRLKPHRPSHHRPLSRTQSSPLVTFSMPPPQSESGPTQYTFTTGIVDINSDFLVSLFSCDYLF